MNDEEFIAEVKMAYQCTRRIPSRGVRDGISNHYASAEGALRLLGRLLTKKCHLEDRSEDWLSGFRQGFEWSDGDVRLNEMLQGLKLGRVVAEAVFNWRERQTEGLDIPPDDWSETEQNMYLMRRDWASVMDELCGLRARVDALSGETCKQFEDRTGQKQPTPAKRRLQAGD